MDSYREHPEDFDTGMSVEASSSGTDATSVIGTDERRMHVRAYNYWASLLGNRDFPSIEDLEPGEVEDFAANSVLLDFTCGRDNPALPYVGAAIRDECELSDDMRTIADVPSRSLLSRLTDHYMQIIANRAPVGFEAEFENPRGETLCYRGILMPFSSDGEQIDFIYGVINWKSGNELVAPADILAPVVDEKPESAGSEPLELTELLVPVPSSTVPESAEPPVHFAWQDGPLHDESDELALPEIALDEDAGLADRLWAARETAESVKAGEGRTRSALYKALSLAYDFALAAQESPQDYAELLEESGVKAQARAPMTPIVKLVFGVDYDKARLTEFAAALSYGQRQGLVSGEFQDFIERQSGGLKALVAAEREARRTATKPDTKTDVARAALRKAAPISLADLANADEFAVVITRRSADGTHEPVAVVEDQALVERAIRRAA
jgi:hypothetical protein